MNARIFGLRRLRRSGRAVWAVYLAVIVGLLGAALVTPSAAAPAAPGGASTVGDYVWFDTNLDSEHTGAANASEAQYTAGIAGVVVELWRWDAASATWVLDGTTTTDATGWYQFPATALATQYEVIIAESNFLPGGPLYGYIYTSAGTYPQPFTMPNVLIYDYKTADFGFARSPLQVSKALLNSMPYATVGDTVTFRITVTNSSTAVTLDPAPLDDFYSPACLTYVTASILPTSVNTATGWLHRDNVGPLTPGQTVVIDVQFTAANSQAMAWKEGGWQDYAPKGIPDFDQRQAGWDAPAGSGTGWYQCGPVAAANSLWWFDSKFEPAPLAPPVVNDNYPLVQSYEPTNAWDDHDARNVAPLVADLSTRMGTTAGTGTTVTGMANGITQFIADAGLAQEYTVTTQPNPAFTWVGTEVRRSEDVVLLLGFWQESVTGAPATRVGGHYVTVSGVDLLNSLVALNDPYRDQAEATGAGRVLPGAHPALHPAPGFDGEVTHNDAQYISQDTYASVATTLPAGVWGPVAYVDPSPATGCAQIANFQGQNVPVEFANVQAACDPAGGALRTTVEYAVAVSPKANTPMCSPTTNIAAVTGATVAESGFVLPPAQSEASVTQGADWGDLPEPPYPTLAASNGPRHLITSPLRLGRIIDGEPNGQPQASAHGDDITGTPDDEDGVATLPGLTGFWDEGTVAAGFGGSLEIIISGGSGVPEVFIGFNGGALAPVVLRDATGAPLPTTAWLPGTYQVYLDIPAGAMAGSPTIPVRVRLSQAGGLPATGLAPDGEVEDYLFQFSPNAVTLFEISAESAGQWPFLVLGIVLGLGVWALRRRLYA